MTTTEIAAPVHTAAAFTDGLGMNDTTIGTATAIDVRTDPTTATARSVLISGGTRGIGAAITNSFISNGDHVATLSRSGASSTEGLHLACDISDAGSVSTSVKAVVEQQGAVDVLVANAGITDDKLMLRMDEDSFNTVLDTNLTGTFRLIKAVAPAMLRARKGRIVIISSVVAFSGSAGQANYAASKAGLIGLCRSLAREFGPRGVTVNVITPGFIETDMTAELGDTRRNEVAANIPIGRFGDAQDVAETVKFLASDAAAYITGAIIPVDGGLGMGH